MCLSHLTGQKLLFLVVAFLHGSVFPQVVERLQLSGHKLPPSDHLLDLLRVLHTFVFSERRSQTVPEVVGTFRILSAEVEELWSRTGRRRFNYSSVLLLIIICLITTQRSRKSDGLKSNIWYFCSKKETVNRLSVDADSFR